MFNPRPFVSQQMLPPRVHPTQQFVTHKCCEYIVPEVHPSHTTVVQNHLYKHYHNFPHTQSVVNQVANQHFICPPGPVAGVGAPVAGAGFAAPGAVAPGMMAPGMMAPGVAPRRFF